MATINGHEDESSRGVFSILPFQEGPRVKPYGMIHFEVRFIMSGDDGGHVQLIFSVIIFVFHLLEQLKLKFWKKEIYFFLFQ